MLLVQTHLEIPLVPFLENLEVKFKGSIRSSVRLQMLCRESAKPIASTSW